MQIRCSHEIATYIMYSRKEKQVILPKYGIEMNTYWYHTILIVYHCVFLDYQGYKKTKNCYFTTYVMNSFGIAQKTIKRNNQKVKQKTKPYNYKTEILGCFINQQLLTEIKQHLNVTYYFF